MCTVIALTNQKGGVGKTTTSSAIICGLTRLNKKVLGVDLDPQGNLGFSLGMEIENCVTIYEVFKNQLPIEEAIYETEFGDIIASNILLSGAELEFNRSGREFMLSKALESVKDKYDYIIIDTPPALNVLTVNAYVAADSLIIPMVPEILSLLGVTQLQETIYTVKQYYNQNLEVLGILMTKYDRRVNLAKEVEEMAERIAEQLDSIVFHSKIRSSVVVAEAPAHGESIYNYAPNSNPALDYMKLVKTIVRMTKNR